MIMDSGLKCLRLIEKLFTPRKIRILQVCTMKAAIIIE